ncbi:succinate dehydrogenase [Rhodalgimonas zhirmunskyi]|uniref:Succinate dehydrogenase n=1 Tax=Rhodalgimonas zhirmunskyi TaxID=2964767 RepID=A0AAJ1U742_9RHOB|nr:succinate dehydrogenase [Rhodoalgimonas zhirmunskyi]MDQ2094696.1 succinate dehydrogenase [Rhodoalgimonas zhirmunskyi]
MRTAFAICAALALGACDVAQKTADDLARTRAKTAVAGVVSREFPGVDASPVTDCIINAASAQELLQIAASSATGATADVTELTLGIARRPEAVRCYGTNALLMVLS